MSRAVDPGPDADSSTPAPSLRRVLVLLNAGAGTLAKSTAQDEPERIRRGLESAGMQVDVESVEGAKIADAARRAIDAGYDAVIGGGGDGTLNAIANVLCGSPVAFGVLPLGTFNHFAKDLGVPLDLDEAIGALAHGDVRDLPVGEVNGDVFLNFSSVGLHPEMVRHRDAQRKALGRGKMWAMMIATVRVLWRFPVMWVRFRLVDPTGRAITFTRVTPSVVIGNNAHQMRVFGLEGGTYEDRSILNVFVARSRGRAGMIWLTLRAMLGRIERAEKFEALSAREVVLDNFRRHVRISIDGEVVDLRPPLVYRINQHTLKVIVPRAEGPAAT